MESAYRDAVIVFAGFTENVKAEMRVLYMGWRFRKTKDAGRIDMVVGFHGLDYVVALQRHTH